MTKRLIPVMVLVIIATFAHREAVAEDARPETLTAFIDSVAAGRNELYSLDLPGDASQMRDLPIGVFDSGIGGLTVLEALLSIDTYNNETHQPGSDGRPDFENERFIYLGDQANMPYGNYPAAGKEPFLRELILRDALFLLGRRYWPSLEAASLRSDKPPVKAIAIACNSATAYGLADIRAALERWKLPVIVVGVIEAGSAAVVERLPVSEQPEAVAIFATVGTCSSRAYPTTLARMAGQAGRRLGPVVQHGSIGLAGAIEGDPAYICTATPEKTATSEKSATSTNYAGPSTTNAAAKFDSALLEVYGLDPAGLLGDSSDVATCRLNSIENYVRYDVASLVEGHRRSGATTPISTVVLGCTHYPLEHERIAAAFQRVREFRDTQGKQPYLAIVAAEITFVDPARYTARQLYQQLVRARLDRKSPPNDTPQHTFYITVPAPATSSTNRTPDGGFTAEYKLRRVAGSFDTEDFRTVPMVSAQLTPAARENMRTRLPHVEAAWRAFDQRP